MHSYPDATTVARAFAPDQPVILNRPHAAARAARFFTEKFPGKSLYAVKANPSPDLLQILWDSGVTHFDVASIAEVRLVRSLLPDATLCFMHPVKTKSAIAEAYREHGVRTFSLDTEEELAKIVEATGGAEDLNLLVRLRVSSEYSEDTRRRTSRLRSCAPPVASTILASSSCVSRLKVLTPCSR